MKKYLKQKKSLPRVYPKPVVVLSSSDPAVSNSACHPPIPRLLLTSPSCWKKNITFYCNYLVLCVRLWTNTHIYLYILYIFIYTYIPTCNCILSITLARFFLRFDSEVWSVAPVSWSFPGNPSAHFRIRFGCPPPLGPTLSAENHKFKTATPL